MIGDMKAQTVRIAGDGGDEIEAYRSEPLDEGRFGGIVVIHHLPGYDEGTKEITRKFAAHGYLAICPNLYSREAPGMSPEEASALIRERGGVPDDRLVGDVDGAVQHLRSLPSSNGKMAVIGFCSGGRQSFLAACRLTFDAAIDCYGAWVVTPPPPGAPLKVGPLVDLAGDLSCPLLGLFGAEDQNPSPEEVKELEKILTEKGKSFEFHTFPDAGHAFFAVDRPNYRPAAAKEGWEMIWEFLGRHLT